MHYAHAKMALRNEQLLSIVERCLESPAAYKLFSMLASIAALDLDARMEYLTMVRESGAYTEEEIDAIERLILGGTAQYLMKVIDRIRDDRIQQEIDVMVTC